MSPTREQRAEAKRQQILAAARTKFLTTGVAETSIDAICAEAGVSKQTIYAYFDGKDDLLRAVLGSLVEDQIDGLAGQLDTHAIASLSQLREHLVALAVRTAEALTSSDYLATVRIIVYEAAKEPEYGAVFASRVAEPVLAAVRAAVRRAHDNGVVPAPPDPESPRLLVGGILTYTLLDGLLRPDDVRRPSRRQLSALVDGYLHGIAGGSA